MVATDCSKTLSKEKLLQNYSRPRHPKGALWRFCTSSAFRMRRGESLNKMVYTKIHQKSWPVLGESGHFWAQGGLMRLFWLGRSEGFKSLVSDRAEMGS